MAGTAIAFIIGEKTGMNDEQIMWFSSLVGYSTFAGVHAICTLGAFQGLAGEAFSDALRAVRSKPRRVNRLSGIGRVIIAAGDGLIWSTQIALIALFAVAALTFTKKSEGWALAAPLTVLTVATAWLDVLLSFSVQYARVHHEEGGLDFPIDERTPPDQVNERAYSDFFYQSAMTQSTFGSTDVAITSRRMRKLVTGHSILAFVFNTVIITTLVSLLV